MHLLPAISNISDSHVEFQLVISVALERNMHAEKAFVLLIVFYFTIDIVGMISLLQSYAVICMAIIKLHIIVI